MSEQKQVYVNNDADAQSTLERKVMAQIEALERWELFRNEMQNHQDMLGHLAGSFLDLGAFDYAAKCAIKADGIKYVLGRMPIFAQ